MTEAFGSDRAISQEHKGQQQQHDPPSLLLSTHAGVQAPENTHILLTAASLAAAACVFMSVWVGKHA